MPDMLLNILPQFLWFAIAAGLSVAVVAGPLGSFVVWRRMAYFGDTLAHSALMGIAFGLLLDINLNVAVTFGCLLLALALVFMSRAHTLATDTLLGILSHSTLALGLISVSLLSDQRIDLMAYLFGDLLSVRGSDIITMLTISLLVLGLLVWLWRPLLAITVHEELAFVEGVPVTAVRTALMLMIALVIAIAMKVVGVLLITALLVIPAATARRLTHTPEHMAIGAAILGCIAVLGGLAVSFWFDTPAGPSVVLCSSLCFSASLLKSSRV